MNSVAAPLPGGALTPLLHKDVVESTVCPHQKAVSTFLPPAQAPPQLPARRVLQLGERGFCPGGRASWPGGVNLSAEFNATTGCSLLLEHLLTFGIDRGNGF